MKDRDQTPLAQPPYRTRPDMRDVIDRQAHEMIADGLVGHSTSPYSAPILLAKKKCGGWRFLTDFRKVNECCNKVVYPLPRIEDSIQRLENPKFFTTLDLTKGFWQIPIAPEDRKFFAFSTESMHLEYLVAPMGAKNSPACLSSLMQLVLRGLPIQHVISYLDDILVADSNMEDHLKHLDQVLAAIEKAGLKLNPSKCTFAADHAVTLGHKLSRDGVSPDPANVEKIKSWKAPTNPKKLRAFLGLTGYYRTFVKDYSKIACCLTDLTRDDVVWRWGEEHQDAFETLKGILTSDLVMCFPNFEKPFIVKMDASLSAIGYVLSQKVEGNEKVVSYGSKKLNDTQRRWSTYDREFFALIAAVRANAHYLRHARFTAITDHRPLLAWRRVDSRKDPTGRRTRWCIELDNYEFDLVYKKGKTHTDADAMSRRGDDDDEEAEDCEEFFGLSFRDGVPDDPNDDFFFFFGMNEDDEHSLVQFNTDRVAIKRLKREQDRDTIISEVKGFVKKRKRLPRTFPSTWFKRNNSWLVIKDGILYRRSYSELVNSNVLQAVIPDSMIPEVLSDLHGSKWAGHPSTGKILLKALRYAVWPSMPRDVKELVQNCKICDQLREQVPKPVTPLQSIVATQVFDHIMCDLISFPVPSFGYKYVLIFKDVFSGFIRSYKLRDKTSQGVLKCLEDLVCFLGPPKLLTSDNGGEFVSDALIEACKLLGIAKRTSCAYRPESQGNVERQNRSLIRALQQRLLEFGKSWSEHLPYVEWVHNTSPYARTNMSPYYVFFGREPSLPPIADSVETSLKDVKGKQLIHKLREKLTGIRDVARRRSEEKREKEAATYNRRVKHVPFEPEEKVWVRADVRHKLQPRWSGPATVRSRRPSPSGSPGTSYICERPDGTICRKNYEQLKKVNARYEENMGKPLSPKKPKKTSGLEFDALLAIVYGSGKPATPATSPVGLPAAPPALASPPAPAGPLAGLLAVVTSPVAIAPAAMPPASPLAIAPLAPSSTLPAGIPQSPPLCAGPTPNLVSNPAVVVPAIAPSTSVGQSINQQIHPLPPAPAHSSDTSRRRTLSIDEYNTSFTGTPVVPSLVQGLSHPSGEGLLPTGEVVLPAGEVILSAGEVALPAGEVGTVAIFPAVVEAVDPNASQIDNSRATISELNQAFIASANSSAAEDLLPPAPLPLPSSPRYAIAPSSPVGPPVGPPEHPLLSKLDRSPLFFTPTPPAQALISAERESTESPPTSESSPNGTRRRIDFSQRNLSEYDQSTPSTAR